MRSIQFARFLAVSSLVFFSSIALAEPTVYVIDTDHTEVGFEVSHLVVSTVSGRFKTFEGSFTFDPKDYKATKLEATADVASVDTGNAKRDEHLRSADFFDAKTNPKIVFKGTKVSGVTKKGFKLSGELTMRGVTRPVTFDVVHQGNVRAYEKERATFVATAVVDRHAFKIDFNDVVEAGPVVGKEVTIRIVAQGIRKSDL